MESKGNQGSSSIPGVVRWAFDFEEWKPTEEEWQHALKSTNEPEEIERIGRFKRPLSSGPVVGRFNPDAKSALIGRLLLRKLINQELGISWNEVKFGRTKEKKPFLQNPSTKFPNFNFNISHAGSFVALGSEPFDIVGVDVMELYPPGNVKTDEDVEEFFDNMNQCFTPFEWKNIRHSSDIKKQAQQFFRHWTLKEGYIKAVGIGLGFDLQRAEFILNNNDQGTSATVRIDGKECPEWKFGLDYLGDKHVVAVACGPPSEAIASYKSTLASHSSTSGKESHTNAPFTILKIEDVLPK